MKFRGVNCSRSRKLFPLVCSFFPILSSHDLCDPTPVALLIPGQAVADPLCAQRAAPSHAVLLCKLCLLLPPCSGCCFSAAFLGQPLGQKVGRWSSRVLGAAKHWRHLGGYVPQGKLYAEKNVFPSLFLQGSGPLKVVGFFLKCWWFFLYQKRHMLTAKLCKKKLILLKSGEQQLKPDLAERPGAHLLDLVHGAGSGKHRPPECLNSCEQEQSIHHKNVRRNFL